MELERISADLEQMGQVIVENESVMDMNPLFESPLLTYLRLRKNGSAL